MSFEQIAVSLHAQFGEGNHDEKTGGFPFLDSFGTLKNLSTRNAPLNDSISGNVT